MCVKRYKMYYANDYIADFVEDYSKLWVTLRIELNQDYDFSSNFGVLDLKLTQNNGIVYDKDVWAWIDEQCVPETRDGIDEILRGLCLSEYDQLAIIHKTHGVNFMNRYWIDFDGKYDFDTMHPLGKYYGTKKVNK